MIKNYLKLTLTLLKRKKLFSLITILGMAIPLMFLMIIITSLFHVTAHEPPESRFDKVIFLDRLNYSIKRENESGNITSPPSYDFIKKYIKPLKTPKKIGIKSFPESFNLYKNNIKSTLQVVFTDDGFWQITDFSFLEGKPFITRDISDSHRIAVIDKKTKEAIFGSEPAVGKAIRIFNKHYTVGGVVNNVDISRQHSFANIWLPITTSEKYMVQDITAPGCNCLILAGSKKQIPAIKAEFAHMINNFDLGNYEGVTAISGELSSDTFSKKVKQIIADLFSVRIKENYILYVFFIIIFFFFVLLPAINLLYIHSSRIKERSSEIGVRKSFGGERKVLSRQFIIENLIITALSGAIGLILTLLVYWLINSSQIIPGLHLSLYFPALLLCIAIWVIFGIFTGILPAIRMSRVPIIDALTLKESHLDITVLTKKIKRLKLILVTEFALTFLALAVILIFAIRLIKNRAYDLGFDYHNVYQVSVNHYDEKSHGWFGGTRGNKEVEDLIKASNMVEYYGKLKNNEPYHYGYTTDNDGIKYNEKLLKDDIHLTIADENMAMVLKLKIIQGRWFDKADKRPDFYPLVINTNLKDQLFQNENPVGKKVTIGKNECEVIGVINHYKYHGEFSTPTFMVFSKNTLPYTNINSWGQPVSDFFRVKPGITDGDVSALAASLSQKFPGYEINISPLASVRSKYLLKTLGPIIVVFSVFFLILLVVLLGLFGVLTYDISLRRAEIGIRRAAGASSGKVFSMILKEMLIWSSFGIMAGIVLLLQLPLLNILPFKTENGILSALLASAIIFALVILSCLIPARQAARIQPAMALHEE